MSLPKLFEILSPQNEGSSSNETLLLRLPFAKNRPESEKILHDLNSSLSSLKMNLQIQKESIHEPTSQEIKKFDQLNNHIQRLQALVDQVAEIFNTASTNK